MELHYKKNEETLDNFRGMKVLLTDSNIAALFPIHVILLGKCVCGGVSFKYPGQSDQERDCAAWVEFLLDPDENY